MDVRHGELDEGTHAMASSSGKAMHATKRAVFWFRRGLRLHDNPALLAAVRESASLTPVFIINRKKHCPKRFGRAKMKFLLESLAALDTELRARNSSLVVLSGDNEKDVILQSMKKLSANALFFEAAPEPHIQVRQHLRRLW